MYKTPHPSGNLELLDSLANKIDHSNNPSIKEIVENGKDLEQVEKESIAFGENITTPKDGINDLDETNVGGKNKTLETEEVTQSENQDETVADEPIREDNNANFFDNSVANDIYGLLANEGESSNNDTSVDFYDSNPVSEAYQVPLENDPILSKNASLKEFQEKRAREIDAMKAQAEEETQRSKVYEKTESTDKNIDDGQKQHLNDLLKAAETINDPGLITEKIEHTPAAKTTSPEEQRLQELEKGALIVQSKPDLSISQEKLKQDSTKPSSQVERGADETYLDHLLDEVLKANNQSQEQHPFIGFDDSRLVIGISTNESIETSPTEKLKPSDVFLNTVHKVENDEASRGDEEQKFDEDLASVKNVGAEKINVGEELQRRLDALNKKLSEKTTNQSTSKSPYNEEDSSMDKMIKAALESQNNNERSEFTVSERGGLSSGVSGVYNLHKTSQRQRILEEEQMDEMLALAQSSQKEEESTNDNKFNGFDGFSPNNGNYLPIIGSASEMFESGIEDRQNDRRKKEEDYLTELLNKTGTETSSGIGEKDSNFCSSKVPKLSSEVIGEEQRLDTVYEQAISAKPCLIEQRHDLEDHKASSTPVKQGDADMNALIDQASSPVEHRFDGFETGIIPRTESSLVMRNQVLASLERAIDEENRKSLEQQKMDDLLERVTNPQELIGQEYLEYLLDISKSNDQVTQGSNSATGREVVSYEEQQLAQQRHLEEMASKIDISQDLGSNGKGNDGDNSSLTKQYEEKNVENNENSFIGFHSVELFDDEEKSLASVFNEIQFRSLDSSDEAIDTEKYNFINVDMKTIIIDENGNPKTLYAYLEDNKVLEYLPIDGEVMTSMGSMPNQDFIRDKLVSDLVSTGNINFQEYLYRNILPPSTTKLL